MQTLRPPLIPLLGFAVSAALAETPGLWLHAGSTRDWIRYDGRSGEARRYHLEFLGSTRDIGHTTERLGYWVTEGDSRVSVIAQLVFTDTVDDWRVRITMPDSPSVEDTAVLRVHNGAVTGDRPDIPAETWRLENATYWLKPSALFPIDLRANSSEDVKKVAKYRQKEETVQVVTGAWEVGLLEFRPMVRIDESPPNLCYAQLWESFCHSGPNIESRGDTGIVSWLANGTFWELTAIDGAMRKQASGNGKLPVRVGERWTYRDSAWNMPSQVPLPVERITLEVLEIGADSAGWSRLLVGLRSHQENGRIPNSTRSILLDPRRYRIRMDTTEAWVWSIVPGHVLPIEVSWALGLLPSPIRTEDSITNYRYLSIVNSGEVNYSTSSEWWELSRSLAAGTTKVGYGRAATMTSYGQTIGSHSGRTWHLESHARDSSNVSTSSRRRSEVRDLAWVRARLVADPSFELTRFGLDGSILNARGMAGLALLDQRGLGILQVRDGPAKVVLRLVRP